MRAFKVNGVSATGCSDPASLLRWRARQRFAYDLILLDMRLGRGADGTALNALKVLPHLMTYAPSSKVVVFSQEDMTVDDALKCIERGALTVVPKGSEVGELCRVVEVYQRLGDQRQTREALISVLWEDVRDQSDRSGQRLEMLVMNLFDSMPTFRVIDNNVRIASIGSVDVLVENQNRHRFWDELDSYHLAVECKDHARALEPTDLNQFKAVVRGCRLAKVGILVSMGPFPEGFAHHPTGVLAQNDAHIFGLGRAHLERLVEAPYDGREEYLRSALEAQ